MTPIEVEQILQVLLTQYKVLYDSQQMGKSFLYAVELFGVKVVYLDGQTFDDKILKDWNIVYIHPDYDINKSRVAIVFALVEGGYFHYLRNNFKNTFNRTITLEGWDKQLIDERLRRYKDKPKYNYFRELNKDTKSGALLPAIDNGFFDYMVD